LFDLEDLFLWLDFLGDCGETNRRNTHQQ
jgi:hypothetical protein